MSVYEGNPVMFRSRPFSFIICVLLIPILLGVVILLIWRWRVKTTSLVVSSDDVVFKYGIFNTHVSEISMPSIRAVKVNQSLLNRIFGTGRISIYTAGDEAEIDVDGMPDPASIREHIKTGQQADKV